MMIHSIYTLATGIFTGQRVGGSELFVAEHTPSGCGAIEGEHDHLRVRLDLGTGLVVAYQPPAPPADALRTWSWDEASWRWVAVKTDEALAADAREERDRRLAACDWVVSRATEQGTPIPAAWAAYRQALRDISSQAGFPGSIQWPDKP